MANPLNKDIAEDEIVIVRYSVGNRTHYGPFRCIVGKGMLASHPHKGIRGCLIGAGHNEHWKVVDISSDQIMVNKTVVYQELLQHSVGAAPKSYNLEARKLAEIEAVRSEGVKLDLLARVKRPIELGDEDERS